MEETVANLRVEVDELHHRDVTPSQSVCKEIKNIALAAEEIIENPEYLVMRRNIAVQTVTSEEVVIPKQDPALYQRSNLAVVTPESGSSMEIDVSSQESAMDIASQESLSAKESNIKEAKSCKNSASAAELAEELLKRDDSLRMREEAVRECQERVRVLEEVIANRQRAVDELEKKIQEHMEVLNNHQAQLADQDLIFKKLETAIKIRELEAEGYKVIPQSSEGCVSLPAKRTRKS